MAKTPTLSDITSQYAMQSALNNNWDSIQASFENTLSRDGSGPNHMGADLDLNGYDILNVSEINVGSLRINGVGVSTSTQNGSIASTTQDGLLSFLDVGRIEGLRFSRATVALLVADTDLTYTSAQAYSVVAGEMIDVAGGQFQYEVAASGASDHHLITANGVKLYYRPGAGDVFPQALNIVGGIDDYPAASQATQLQLALDIASETKKALNLGGFRWRSDATLHLNGVDTIKSTGATLYFPPTGTYDYFRLDDDSGDANSLDATRIAFDVSGVAFTIVGNLYVYGVTGLNSFTIADRAQVQQDLAAFAGRTGPVSELTVTGQLVVQGFAYWAYVPSLDTNFGTRLFARVSGQIRSRFNLTPLGRFGASASGLDDSNMNFRTDRCGGYGSVTESKIQGTEFNCGYFFGTGLTDKTADKDWEATTINVTNGGATITLSGAGSSVLNAGDYIVILDAYTRSTDSRAIPLVALIASKTSDTEFELDAKTLPNLTDTNLNWFYRPPRISLSVGNFTAHTAYFEGYWDCLELEDNNRVYVTDLKGGGVRLSGRHQGIIHTTGLNNSIIYNGHRTLFLSNGIEAVVSYGMVRETADQYDSPLYLHATVPFRTGDSAMEVLPAKGVDPVQFFQTNRTSRFGTRVSRINVKTDYTNLSIRNYFTGAGLLQSLMEEDGLNIQNNVTYAPSTKVGTVVKNVAMTTSPATVYDRDDLADRDGNFQLGTWRIIASEGARTWSEAGLFTVDASGTVRIDEAGGTNITFSGSTTNLQAALTSGSGTVGFTLIRRT